jgi:vitamin K epoxide reductase family protein
MARSLSLPPRSPGLGRFPMPGAAAAYLIETLMGAMGTASRWRTMPWMVTLFFILVVPLGGVSIFFIIIQPIMIGTYCTLCLLAAAAMLIMIPLTLDEVVAMAQYMLRSVRTGRPFWRTFFQGGPEPNGTIDENDPGFSATLGAQATAAFRGHLRYGRGGPAAAVLESAVRALASGRALAARGRNDRRRIE